MIFYIGKTVVNKLYFIRKLYTNHLVTGVNDLRQIIPEYHRLLDYDEIVTNDFFFCKSQQMSNLATFGTVFPSLLYWTMGGQKNNLRKCSHQPAKKFFGLLIYRVLHISRLFGLFLHCTQLLFVGCTLTFHKFHQVCLEKKFIDRYSFFNLLTGPQLFFKVHWY